MRTGNNKRFLRTWSEVSKGNLSTDCESAEEVFDNDTKWIPYDKGGGFRKWYGNKTFVVNWENDGEEVKEATRKKYPELDSLGWKISNEDEYFNESVTWTLISSGSFGARSSPKALFTMLGDPLYFQMETQNTIFYHF